MFSMPVENNPDKSGFSGNEFSNSFIQSENPPKAGMVIACAACLGLPGYGSGLSETRPSQDGRVWSGTR